MPATQSLKFATQTFGDRLRELSSKRGSYSEVARDLGINRQQFARYLNGTSRPRDALVRKMAEYFQVDSGAFFQDGPLTNGPAPTTALNPTAAALSEVMSGLCHEPVTEAELRSGLYMQYKLSFADPSKVACLLCRVWRDDAGVVRYKRRYSVKIVKALPGVRVDHINHGVLVKMMGALVLFETDGVAGDVMMSAFRPAHLFTLADRVKSGLLMTHGRAGGFGPMVGQSVIERVDDVDDQGSILEHARRQGFCTVDALPDYIQTSFNAPRDTPSPVLTAY